MKVMVVRSGRVRVLMFPLGITVQVVLPIALSNYLDRRAYRRWAASRKPGDPR